MRAEEAAQLVHEIEHLRRRTRASLHHVSFPCVMFGALMLASAAIVATAGGPSVGLFWMVAGPLGGVATGRHYQRRERRMGLEGPAWPGVAVGLGIMAGCFLTGGLGGALGLETLAAVGPLLVVSAGGLGFALLHRSVPAAVVAVALATLVVGLWAMGVGPRQLGPLGTALYGATLLGLGLAYRAPQRG